MYSARWLPANPVIPVMRTRIARQISKDRAFGRLPGLRSSAAFARSQGDTATESRIDVTRLLCGRWEFGTRAAPPAPGAAGAPSFGGLARGVLVRTSGRKSTWEWYMAKALLSLLLVVAMSVGMQGIALADPSPPDSPQPTGPAVGIPNIFPTLPFQLGEIDTTALGVSDTELAGVGLSGIDPADSASSSSGSLLTVGNDLAQCPEAQYPTIQAAVNAAFPGDQ